MPENHPLTQRLMVRLLEGSDEPPGRLIVDEIWLAAVEGTMPSGSRLPTTRQVAISLGISPRTVEAAYRELEERGVVATRPGEGTFISLHPPSEVERERHRQLAELCRGALQRAEELGFGIDDMMDCLSDFRHLGPRGNPR